MGEPVPEGCRLVWQAGPLDVCVRRGRETVLPCATVLVLPQLPAPTYLASTQEWVARGEERGIKSRVTLGLGPGFAIVLLDIRQITLCLDFSAFSPTDGNGVKNLGTDPTHLTEP